MMNLPEPSVDNYVQGTREGVRAMHSQCLDVAEVQPERLHEFMSNSAGLSQGGIALRDRPLSVWRC